MWTRWPAAGESLASRSALWSRALGVGRSLDGVDVEVVRADVRRVAAQDGFEHGDDLFGAFRGPALRTPQLPRVDNHRGVRPQRRRVEVVRVLRHQLAHRVAVSHPQLRAGRRSRPRRIFSPALRGSRARAPAPSPTARARVPTARPRARPSNARAGWSSRCSWGRAPSRCPSAPSASSARAARRGGTSAPPRRG